MCGLIAFVRSSPTVPLPPSTAALCRQIGGRGPHGHGWAIFTGSQWTLAFGEGPLADPPSGPWMLAVGHSRLATSGRSPGTIPAPEDGQPLAVGGWVIAHNGTLKQHRHPRLSDSATAVEGAADGLAALTRLSSPDGAPQAAIATDGRTVAMWRTGNNGGHPLYRKTEQHVTVIASIPTPGAELAPTGLTLIPNPQEETL